MKNCKLGNTIDEVVAYVESALECPMQDYRGGCMLGLQAKGYIGTAKRLGELPWYRESDHAVVFSIECSWREEEELIARLRPVDFARDGDLMIFCCYSEKYRDRYRDVFLDARLEDYDNGRSK